MKFKAIATAFLVVCGITAKAASPAATLDWVTNYVAQMLASYGRGGDSGSSSTGGSGATVNTNSTASFCRTFTSYITISNEVYELSITMESSTNLALVVCSSDVPGVTNGTIYAWNSTLGCFSTTLSASMGSVTANTYHDVSVTTNLLGEVHFTTNVYNTYSATANGTNYWSTSYYGKQYLVSERGFGGNKIEFITTYVSDAQIRMARPVSVPVVRSFSLFLSAYADEPPADSEIVTHNNGTITVTSIAITKKGKTLIKYLEQDEKFVFNSGLGDGTAGNWARAAFENWLSSPSRGNYTEAKSLLMEKAGTDENWGVPDNPNGTFTADDGTAVMVGQITASTAWKSAKDAAVEWMGQEFHDVFYNMWLTLKTHYCPSLGPDNDAWTPELTCKCQHKYKDFPEYSDSWIYCEKRDVCQHQWVLMAVVNGCLSIMPEGSAACKRCARCGQCNESEGAVHVTVPDDYDYCGCYCMYYYQKKAEPEPDPPAVEPEPEEIPPEIPVVPIPDPPVITPDPPEPEPEEPEECDDSDYPIEEAEVIEIEPNEEEEPIEETVTTHDEQGEEIEITVPKREDQKTNVHVTTNKIDQAEVKKRFGKFYIIWRRSAAGGWQKMIVSERSKESAYEKKHHAKPENPLKCVCPCGCSHWFKPSPCPLICRGCSFHKDAFDFDPGILTVEGTNYTINVRAAHAQMNDGYWDEETYKDENGLEHTWSNKDGDATYPSPYTAWYYGTLTNGYHDCGCACGRFYSTASGAHGKPGKDTDGSVIDDGHHGNFHIYGLRNTAEIACPFTRYYYIDYIGGIPRMKSCSCNNHAWESASKNNVDPYTGRPYLSTLDNPYPGWVGIFNNETPSLACGDVCMWCWPSNHYTATETDLNHLKHKGIALADSVLTGSVATAYNAWLGLASVDPVCGCICQALNESTCQDYEGESDDDLTYQFDVNWSSIVNADYHFYDLEESCLCKCSSKIHLCVTEERLEELYPDEELRPDVTFTDCSREKGQACAVCGFYDQDGRTNTLKRATISSHHIQSGHCACACSLEAENDSSKKMFKREDDGKFVRGWSAKQDGDRYPNNTRPSSPTRKSAGYMSDDEKVEEFHKSGMSGCTCNCKEDAEHVLFHKFVEGEACTDVCKQMNGTGQYRSMCQHTPQYYKKANGVWSDDLGVHVRTNSAAEYCGCDCGYDTTVGGIYGYLTGHFRKEDGSMCYCYGKYSTNKYHQHGDPQLIAHVNPQVDEDASEAYETTCDRCGRPLVHSITHWFCDNGHTWTVSNEDSHDHVFCDVCGHTPDANVDCDCYCHKNGLDSEGGNFNICDPLLTPSGLTSALTGISLGDIFGVDGDEPVYAIADCALTNVFANLPNIQFVHFNYCTNLGDRALAGAFSGCTGLKDVSFRALPEIRYGSMSNTFSGCSGITNMDFRAVTNIGRYALQELSPAQVLHLERLASVSPLYRKPLCACNVSTVRLDYVRSVLPLGPFFGTNGVFTMKAVIPSVLISHYSEAGWPSANLVATNTLTIGGWKVYRNGVDITGQGCEPTYHELYDQWQVGGLYEDFEDLEWDNMPEGTECLDDCMLYYSNNDNTEFTWDWGYRNSFTNHVFHYRAVRTYQEVQ